jgi:glycosyltransferase involved in cell wall biosynthesis
MLKLAFDRQIYRRQALGGISRYFTGLQTGLQAHPQVRLVAQRDADVLHATFYKGVPRKHHHQRLVSSLFDMIPERLPAFFPFISLRDRFGIGPHANKMDWLRASDLIVSISQASADELQFFMPDVTARVKIIHLASLLNMHHLEPVPSINSQRLWLYVGKRTAYKNWITLLMGMARVRPAADNPILFAAGGGAWSPLEKRLIAEHGLENRVMHRPVSDTQLAWLYHQAEAVFVPSMAEGFSLPLIEALHADAPVIASDIQAHREVAGAYATLISPCCIDAWTELMNAAAMQSLPRPTAVLGSSKWKQLVDYYGPERMAREHLEVYSNLI